MANNYSLDVQNTASVESWKQEVQRLNERTEQVVREAGQALEEFRTTAEGNVFEQVCNYSSQVISGTTKVLQGMTEILNAVNDLVNMIKNKGAELVQGVAGVVGKVFGG